MKVFLKNYLAFNMLLIVSSSIAMESVEQEDRSGAFVSCFMVVLIIFILIWGVKLTKRVLS